MEKFERNKFYDVSFEYDGFSDAIASIYPVEQSGTFEYYVTFISPGQESKGFVQASSGFFQIPPKLNHPMDGIVIKTCVPKWMGPLNEWSFHVQRTSELGYNMVHFCPLQQRGMSNSPYSIFDQMKLSDDLFASEQCQSLTEDQKYDCLNKVISEMSEKYHIDSVIDIVWNHTACNSDWIRDHPDSGRNFDAYLIY